MDDRRYAVLLLAHGTPDSVDEIPEYLKNVVSGRAIPQHVIEEIQHRYAQIGKSPLTEWTFRQAKLLENQIALPVYVGMRNWRPYIADTVRSMRANGITDAVAICMAPQNSRTSVGLYRRAAYAEAGSALRLHFIDAWAEHPRLIDAFAERLQATREQAGLRAAVLFTAHSVPCRTVQSAPASSTAEPPAPTSAATNGPIRPTAPERSYAIPANAPQVPDLYSVESKQTAAAVAACAGLGERDWCFAFQSQGASGGPWIGPTVEDTLGALKQEGRGTVILQPIGFLCDHVEILYDIDIAFQEAAAKLGLRLLRPASLNDSPLLIEALVDLAQQGIAKLRAEMPEPA